MKIKIHFALILISLVLLTSSQIFSNDEKVDDETKVRIVELIGKLKSRFVDVRENAMNELVEIGKQSIGMNQGLVKRLIKSLR